MKVCQNPDLLSNYINSIQDITPRWMFLRKSKHIQEGILDRKCQKHIHWMKEVIIVLMDTFEEWIRINGFKFKHDVRIKKHKHFLIGRGDRYMQFNYYEEKLNMSKLLKCHMEIIEDKVHKRWLWCKACKFSYQGIRIIESFHGWEKMSTMPTQNFNVPSIKGLAPSVNIDHNKDPQHAQSSKK